MATDHVIDFLVADHGSIVILTPFTPAGNDWVAEHLPEDAQRWSRGVAIERRYWPDICDGILDAGLSLT
jgi:hypothetical protein